MNYLETYNASEGFFGFQNDLSSKDMLLLTNHGVFYEFEDTKTKEICDLNNLEWLDFSYNNLKTVPPEIEKLTSLKTT